MSNIVPFASAQVPAHLADVFGADSNITSRTSINQLSVKGKVWRRIVDGEETQLTRPDPETGDRIPVSIVSLIVLDQNRNRSRAYHPGGFEEGKNAAPVCYSADGVAPDADVKEPCAKTCAACPNSVKGSKITENNKQVTACSPYKRIAVVPTGAVASHPIMLLKLAQTSIWDKDNGENEAQGWYAWDQYLDMLRARGAKHTAAVETKVKFDIRAAYPKLLFSASRWLTAEEASAAKARIDNEADTLKAILTGSASHDGVTGTSTAEYAAQEKAAPAQASAPDPAVDTAAEAAFAAAEKAKADKAEKAKAEKAARAQAAKEAAEAAAKAAAAAAAAAEADDDGFGGVTDAPVKRELVRGEAASAASTPVSAPATVAGTPAGLSDLLAGWDA